VSSNKTIKNSGKQLKKLKIFRRIMTTLEVIFGIIFISVAVVMFVPGVKTELVKAAATTSIGKKFISWMGSKAYADSVLDKNFNSKNLKTNKLKYNYSQEYTNFVLFGVDSREGEVDTSNSDSILIVSIHNTTKEVKMVSVYRDTMLGICDKTGTINQYFKVNSAYSYGGPEGAINTLNLNLDLDLKDYVTVNFGGVADIITKLGGITVNLTDDELAQLNHHLKSTISSTGQYAPQVAHSGKNIKLNGIQATTYCRIRKATFYDPKTGEPVSDDFGRAARQRSVMEKLVEKAKKAGVSELQGMVETVLNDKNAKGQIITTSFKFDEIVNLLPIIFDFKLSGSTGFPSTLQTGTFDRTSYVVASGLSNNVSKLHEYLYGEKNYVPTENVNSVDYAVTSKTGISENSAGFNPTEKVDGTSTSKDGKQPETTESSFDYDDKGKSDFY
jgi:LCP family protein required for cell wall assembly